MARARVLVCWLGLVLVLALGGGVAAASAQTISGRVVSASTRDGVAHVEACAESSTWGGACAESLASGDYSITVPETGYYVVEFFAPPRSELMWRTYYPGTYSYNQAKEVDVRSGEGVAGVNIELLVGGRISGVVSGAPSATRLAGIVVCASEPETLVIIGREGNGGCSLSKASGEYVVTGLPGAEYEVKFEVPRSSGLDYFTQFYDDKENEWEANLVKVSTGKTTTAIDDELALGGQIDGVVTSAETGKPIAGGEICANWTGGGTEYRCAKTNAKGEYALLPLRTGKFWVEFSAAGYVSEYYGGFTRFTEAAVVPVTDGKATSGIDFALKEPGRVSGRITNVLTHANVGGVEVCLQEVESTSDGPCARSNPRGEYTIDGVQRGEYTTVFLPAPLNYLTQYYDGALTPYEAKRFRVNPGDVITGVDAELEEPASISGTVTSLSGTALEGIYVCAGEVAGPRQRSCVHTDAAGEYTISGLAARTFYVEFQAGKVHYLTEYYGGSETRAQATRLTLEAASATTGINARMAPIEGAGIYGWAQAREGERPIAGLEVCAETPATHARVGCTSTNLEGEYTLMRLAPGEYIVEFSSPPSSGLNWVRRFYSREYGSQTPSGVYAEADSLTPGVFVEMTEGGRVNGRVTDSTTEVPLAGVEVCAIEAVSSEAAACATTATGGSYSIEGLRGGRYDVDFMESQYATEYYKDSATRAGAEPVTVIEGGTTEGIDAKMTREAALSGRVTSIASAAGLEGIQVCATERAAEKGGGHCAYSGAEGAYTITGLTPGGYLVEFSPKGVGYLPAYYDGAASRAQADTLPLAAGEARAGLDATLTPISGGGITGTARSASGTPIAGIEVCASDESEEPPSLLKETSEPEKGLELPEETSQPSCATTDAEGEYVIEGLAEGATLVEFFSPESRTLNYIPQFYDEASDYQDAKRVPITPGTLTPGVSARLTEGGRVEGVVREAATGNPLEHIDVCASPAAARATYSGGCSSTGAEGEYTIASLATGEYDVAFFPLEEGDGSNFLLSQYYDNAPSLEDAVPVRVSAGESTPRTDANLLAGGAISGLVTDAATGAPLANVFACALTTIVRAARCAITSASGRFTIGELAPGSYTVGFNAGKRFATQYYQGSASFSGAEQITVSANVTTENVNAAMHPASTPSASSVTAPAAHTSTPAGGGASSKATVAPAPGVLALLSSHVAVNRKDVASVEVQCSGASTCHVRMTLLATRIILVHKRRQSELLTLGSLELSLEAGHKSVEQLHLDSSARALLSTHHGRLAARLSIGAAPTRSSTPADVHSVLLIETHPRR